MILTVAGAVGCADPAAPSPPVTTGTIEAKVVTTGPDIDGNGYQLHLDGVPVGDPFEGVRRIGANSSVRLSVGPGSHAVRLVDVADNCVVLDGDQVVAVVERGRITAVRFFVVCAPTSGNARTTIRTSGIDLDRDGYYLRFAPISFSARLTTLDVSINDSVEPRIVAGRYAVTLNGVSANCEVGSPSRVIEMKIEETVTMDFEVSCARVTQLVYASGGELHVANANGTDRVRLRSTSGTDEDPAWSPRGDRIAFVRGASGADIYVVDPDGSDLTKLTNRAAAKRPTWSPDGSRIAFASDSSGNFDLYVMNADGSNTVRLTDHPAADTEPAWSPDGRSIAFTSERGGFGRDLYLIGLDDGTVIALQTSEENSQPTWSPDGSRLAFVRSSCADCTPDVFFMDVDRPGAAVFVAVGDQPAWSPDGRVIAFQAWECGYYCYYYEGPAAAGIRIARLDGTEPVDVLPAPAAQPSWRGGLDP